MANKNRKGEPQENWDYMEGRKVNHQDRAVKTARLKQKQHVLRGWGESKKSKCKLHFCPEAEKGNRKHTRNRSRKIYENSPKSISKKSRKVKKTGGEEVRGPNRSFRKTTEVTEKGQRCQGNCLKLDRCFHIEGPSAAAQQMVTTHLAPQLVTTKSHNTEDKAWSWGKPY